MGVGRSRVAFLVAAHPHTTAPGPTDISGGQCDVHQRAVRAVVVISPNQPLLISEHGPPSRAALLGLRYPFGRLADLIRRQTCDLRRLVKAVLLAATAFSKSLVEAAMKALSVQPFSLM